MIKLILRLWQLPQLILGKIVHLFIKKRTTYLKTIGKLRVDVYLTNYNFNISFGPIIFLNKLFQEEHEYGHSIWSAITGPMYLPVHGVCSFVGNMIWKLTGRKYDYYKMPWEWLADKLGGVKRGKPGGGGGEPNPVE